MIWVCTQKPRTFIQVFIKNSKHYYQRKKTHVGRGQPPPATSSATIQCLYPCSKAEKKHLLHSLLWIQAAPRLRVLFLLLFNKSVCLLQIMWHLFISLETTVMLIRRDPWTETCPSPSESNCSSNCSCYFIHLLHGCALGDDQLSFLFNKPM